MKGVVLSGGTGSRLRPITFSMAKQLVPVANRPILNYGLQDMADAGITEVAIIISPETGGEIRKTVGDGSQLGLEKVEYIVQDAPKGLAHALGCALPWADGDDVLMYLGDNLIKQGVADVVDDFTTHEPNCQILLTPVDNPSDFGVAQLDDGQVVQLIEKPSDPPSNLALVGVYLFDSSITEAVASIRPSARGELEITDAIQWLVDNGKEVRPSIVNGWWKDTGKKEDLLDANQLILADMENEIDGELIDTVVRGNIRVEKGARLVDCQVTGPAVVGAGTQMARTTIGPNTAIGNECRIADASIEGSIIMDGAEVRGWKLHNSLLGHEVKVKGAPPPGFVEMTLGERSEVDGE
ncbi:MAG: glucose-1-phosphate thymidylyltransferase [Acidimicrobiia bacterium]|nr:glucose-1-phosphate thymidylyltransferase [Acidimicrobiia bacterium]